MAKLKVQTGVDNPVLRKVSEPVKRFDAKLKKLVKDMKDTMVAEKGLGMAAPQVGVHLRVFLTTLNYKEEGELVIVMVNPEILEFSEKKEVWEEGCLSLPGQYENVERPSSILVKFFDLKGNEQSLRLEGMNARVIQHENDHLDGVLFVDRV